eukprot:COSAG06_NODE_2261_length_7212_cov_80.772951_6_plen_40_part_00
MFGLLLLCCVVLRCVALLGICPNPTWVTFLGNESARRRW